MKIGMCTGSFKFWGTDRSIRDNYRADIYKRMKSLGVDCADLGAIGQWKDHYYQCDLDAAIKWAKEERKVADDAGIIINQVHGPWPTDDTTPENRAEKLGVMERAIHLTSALGCKHLVIHPDMPFGWGYEKDPEFAYATNYEMFTKLLPLAQDKDVILCIENMPMTCHALSRTPRMYEFVCDINHPNLGMCFDTGHANVFNDDCGEMIRLIGPVLKVLHVHDNLGDKDSHLHPLDGTIDFESFIHGLRDVGYTGCFSLEANVGCTINDPRFDEMATSLLDKAHKIINMP